ncbi:hypothetical protein HBE96_09860 [Clostridium sp. P21]|uniref:Uncharacterized protein n=1 Tax=Clostridium muellerianum TaxID=2716538 RepID=A0A7Y0HNT9_9CLOT|nr:hypothetical protein [Clostridium muellerianum]NMM63002.1 hypothetical protein [Clostridium muellerianum]
MVTDLGTKPFMEAIYIMLNTLSVPIFVMHALANRSIFDNCKGYDCKRWKNYSRRIEKDDY